MSTSTARFGFVKPDPSDIMSQADVDLSTFYTKIDNAIGAQVVTTDGAVAVGPTQGQIAFATTSYSTKYANEFHVYNGTRWGYLANLNEGKGLVNFGKSATQVTCGAGSETKIIQVTNNNFPGNSRELLIIASFFKQHNGTTGTANYRLRFASGTTVTTAGTLIEQFDVNGLNTGGTLGTQVNLATSTTAIGSGQFTVGLFCNNPLANSIIVSGAASDDTHLIILDDGTFPA